MENQEQIDARAIAQENISRLHELKKGYKQEFEGILDITYREEIQKAVERVVDDVRAKSVEFPFVEFYTFQIAALDALSSVQMELSIARLEQIGSREEEMRKYNSLTEPSYDAWASISLIQAIKDIANIRKQDFISIY